MLSSSNFIKKEPFAFFSKGVLSQWHHSPFMVKDVMFNNCEQFMMFQKATVFCDIETAAKILEATHPRECKELGRKVRNFNHEIWDQVKQGIVFSGNYHKFNFHKEMRDVLFETKGLLLVEASPFDSIWGIGMSIDDPDVMDRDKWRGKNLLGWALTCVRETLLFKENTPEAFKYGRNK